MVSNNIIAASHLRSITALANEGAAAARPLCEHDPVRVILRPLDKLGDGTIRIRSNLITSFSGFDFLHEQYRVSLTQPKSD